MIIKALLYLTLAVVAIEAQNAGQLWAEVDSLIQASPLVPTGAFIFGNSTHTFHVYEKNLTTTDSIIIASATKPVFAVVALKMVELGLLTLQDKPSRYLSWWTTDPADPRSLVTVSDLLSFQSGFQGEHTCLENPLIGLTACVKKIYNESYAFYPGNFSYGGTHMQILGAMILQATGARNYDDLVGTWVRTPLGIDESCFHYFPYPNVRLDGGMSASASCFNVFLRAWYNKSPLLLQTATFDNMETDKTANSTWRYSPAWAFGFDFHYGYGDWLECPTNWTASCYNVKRYAAIGGTGAYSLIDYVDHYNALFWRQDSSGGDSYLFYDSIRPNITRAVQASQPYAYLITSGSLTSAPLTTSPLTTSALTTQRLTTGALTTSPVTSSPLTTSPLTTSPVTSAPLTTSPLTTAALTTQRFTSAAMTTQRFTSSPLTTSPLTTSPLTTARGGNSVSTTR